MACRTSSAPCRRRSPMASMIIGMIFGSLTLGMLVTTAVLLYEDYGHTPNLYIAPQYQPHLHHCERCGALVAGELDRDAYPDHPPAVWASADEESHCLCRGTCLDDFVREWEARQAQTSAGR